VSLLGAEELLLSFPTELSLFTEKSPKAFKSLLPPKGDDELSSDDGTLVVKSANSLNTSSTAFAVGGVYKVPDTSVSPNASSIVEYFGVSLGRTNSLTASPPAGATLAVNASKSEKSETIGGGSNVGAGDSEDAESPPSNVKSENILMESSKPLSLAGTLSTTGAGDVGGTGATGVSIVKSENEFNDLRASSKGLLVGTPESGESNIANAFAAATASAAVVAISGISEEAAIDDDADVSAANTLMAELKTAVSPA
jgi:hypothetical protein